MNTTRFDGAGFGLQTAAINASGGASPGSARKTEVESYDGTNWTEVNEVNVGRYAVAGVGSQTAGLIYGGYSTTVSPNYTNLNESWDGTSWTEIAELNAGRTNHAVLGVQTLALCAGGYNGSANTTNVEKWNGSAWTEIADMNTAREQAAYSGTDSGGLVFGGEPHPPASSLTEYWNGSSWTEVGDLGTKRSEHMGSGKGTSNAALAAGGGPGGKSDVEEWSAPSTFRQLNIGDIYYNADPSSGVLKYTGYGTGAWASGGNLNSPRGYQTGAGTQTAGLAIAGYNNPPGVLDLVESYNGTSWTELSEVNEARSEGGGS